MHELEDTEGNLTAGVGLRLWWDSETIKTFDERELDDLKFFEAPDGIDEPHVQVTIYFEASSGWTCNFDSYSEEETFPWGLGSKAITSFVQYLDEHPLSELGRMAKVQSASAKLSRSSFLLQRQSRDGSCGYDSMCRVTPCVEGDCRQAAESQRTGAIDAWVGELPVGVMFDLADKQSRGFTGSFELFQSMVQAQIRDLS